MADDFKKAEPSRWESGVPGHIPTFSGHKLRRMAAEGRGEIAAHVMEVQRLFRVEPENRTGEQPRHVVDLEDVTRGLGLDSADAQRIQKLVSSTSAHFNQKTQTQKLMSARGRLLSVLRDSMKHVPSDTRRELVTRAVAWWKRHSQTDYGKKPTVRAGGEMQKSNPILAMTVDTLLEGPSRPQLIVKSGGWIKTAKGYKRRRGGKWEYYYPHPDGKPGKKVKKRKKKPASTQLSLFDTAPKKEAPQQPAPPDAKPSPSRTDPESVMTRATAALALSRHKGDFSQLRALSKDTEALVALQDYVKANKNRPAKLGKVRKLIDALSAVGEGGISESVAQQARARLKVKRELRSVADNAPPGGWTDADRVSIPEPKSARPAAEHTGLESTGVPQIVAATASGEAPHGEAGRVLSEEMKSQLASVRPGKSEVLIDGTPHRVEKLIGGNRGFGGEMQQITLHLKTKAGRRAVLSIRAGSNEAHYLSSSQGEPQPVAVAFPAATEPDGTPETGKVQSLTEKHMVRKYAGTWFVAIGPGGTRGEVRGMQDGFKTKKAAVAAARKIVTTWHASHGLPLPEGYEDHADLYQAHRSVNEARGFKDAPGRMPKIPDATGSIKLQAVGRAPAKSVSEIQPGDTLMWNYGETSTVQKIQKVSPKFAKVTTRTKNGKEYTRRMKLDRLVGLDPDKHGFQKSHPALEALYARPPALVVFG